MAACSEVGYNWQASQWVLGLEGDGDWSDMHGTTNLFGCALGPCQTRNDFLATFRGRIGYAFDRWMPYFTGGFAVGNIRATNSGFAGVDQTNSG